MNSFLKCLSLLLIGISVAAHAQTGNVGIGTTTPNAKLHVNGDLQVDDLESVTNATQSVVIDPNTSKFAVAAYPPTAATVGDAKQGFQAGDHAGWVLLNGRALSSLTSTQQTAAASLGFSGNLPNATGRVLKQSGAVALGATAGGNTAAIAQTNLPNYNLPTATTSAGGNHTHTESYISNFQTTGWGNTSSYSFGTESVPDNSNYTGYLLTGEAGAANLKAALRIQQSRHNTSVSGSHTHTVTVSSGGSGTALSVENAYLNTNTFIYLGN